MGPAEHDEGGSRPRSVSSLLILLRAMMCVCASDVGYKRVRFIQVQRHVRQSRVSWSRLVVVDLRCVCGRVSVVVICPQ
jgi:hypothetical protein